MAPSFDRLNRAIGLQKTGEKYRLAFSQQPPPPPIKPSPPPPIDIPVTESVKKVRRTSSFDSVSSSLSSLSFDEPATPSSSQPRASYSTLLTAPNSSTADITSGLIPIGLSPSIAQHAGPHPFRPPHRFSQVPPIIWHRNSLRNKVPPCPHPNRITFANVGQYHKLIWEHINTLEENTDAPHLSMIYHPKIRLLHRPYTIWFYDQDAIRCKFTPTNWAAERRKGRITECLMSDGTVAIICKECWEFIRLCEAYLGQCGQGQRRTSFYGLMGGMEDREKKREERWLVTWWRRDVEGVVKHLEDSLFGGEDGELLPFKRIGGPLEPN